MSLPVDARKVALRDPETVRRLRDGAATVAGSPAAGAQGLVSRWELLEIVETFADATSGLAGKRIGDVARARGGDPFEVLLDVVLADDLQTGLMYPALEDDEESRRMRAEVWRDPRTVVGGSDAGAHVEMMCGATYTTRLFSESVRERELVTLERAVQVLTEEPARLYGLRDRGRTAPGSWADIVVFDPTTIGPEPVHTRRDLPGGAQRLYAGARGVEHVLVNGTEIVTGATLLADERPGHVLRAGASTDPVSLGVSS